MKQSCDLYGLDFLIHTNRRDDKPSTVFSQIAGGRTDGAVVYLTANSPLLRYAQESSFPIVSIRPALDKSAKSGVVGTEHTLPETVRSAVAKLVELIDSAYAERDSSEVH
jgi:hypothetical protein